MPYAKSKQANIYFEETGHGTPILFLHEFAGDHRSWADQVRYFSRGYRCISMAARGYPPSDVPEGDDAYGQELANLDAIAVLDHLQIDRAHVVGLSMGGYTALQLAIHFPDRLRSAVPAGAGSGSHPSARKQFLEEALASSRLMEKASKLAAEQMGLGPTRVQLLNKDPQGWRTFVQHLGEHPPTGSARVMRNVQGKRPSLYELEQQLRAVKVPILLIVGDEDEPCLDANLFMKRIMPSAQLAILPGCGHVLNYEEPALMNHLVERFLGAVDRGSWRPRDPRAVAISGSTFGAMLAESAGKT
jgi:pimeloyl-ACP methyl ester carboxylesterase